MQRNDGYEPHHDKSLDPQSVDVLRRTLPALEKLRRVADSENDFEWIARWTGRYRRCESWGKMSDTLTFYLWASSWASTPSWLLAWVHSALNLLASSEFSLSSPEAHPDLFPPIQWV